MTTLSPPEKLFAAQTPIPTAPMTTITGMIFPNIPGDIPLLGFDGGGGKLGGGEVESVGDDLLTGELTAGDTATVASVGVVCGVTVGG